MRNKMIRVSTKVMAAILVAASVITTTPIAHAEENPAVVEEVQVETEESTVVEETTETEETTEEVEVPVVETTEVEGQGDIIDDEFAYVEGQGDVIDDEFAVVDDATVVDESTVEETTEVEGQGDVIDDEFAVAPEAEVQPATESLVLIDAPVIDVIMNEVEGQGDVIDDQFAVTPEAEAAVEAAEVAENDTEVAAASVNSFVAVGPAASEENKSEITESLENLNKAFNPLNTLIGDPVCKEIDNCDVLGHDEKEIGKLFVKTGLGVAEGVVCGEILPGFGAIRKGTKMAENFSKALDAKTRAEEIAYTIEGVKNFGEAIVSAVPGGGFVVAAANVKQAIQGYCAKKVVDFVKWLF